MRPLLSSTAVTPAASAAMTGFHADVVLQAQQAIAAHEWVVIGMAQNPVVRKARKLLDGVAKPYHYIEHGSYFSRWKLRLAIKLWSGWPTFPQVFHNGMLVGGATELSAYLATHGSTS